MVLKYNYVRSEAGTEFSSKGKVQSYETSSLSLRISTFGLVERVSRNFLRHLRHWGATERGSGGRGGEHILGF